MRAKAQCAAVLHSVRACMCIVHCCTAEAACDCESTGLNWGPFPSKLGASQLRLFVGLFWALLRVTVFGGFQSCEATMRSAFKFEFEWIWRQTHCLGQ